MNGSMRLQRVTKRTYRLTGFRRIATVGASQRIALERSFGATRGDSPDASHTEARQLPESRRPAP